MTKVKDMSFHEAAKLLKTTNVKLLAFLREKKILFRSNKLNLPTDKYADWFDVSLVPATYSEIMVTYVKIKGSGFIEIENIYKQSFPDAPKVTRESFLGEIKIRLNNIYERMNLRRNILKEFIKWNKETGVHEIYYHDGIEPIKIFEYNLKTLTINELQ